MCGISVMVKPETFETDHMLAIREMARIQHHRGLDSTGFAKYSHVLFAHIRLSLIDLHDRSNKLFGMRVMFDTLQFTLYINQFNTFLYHERFQ